MKNYATDRLLLRSWDERRDLDPLISFFSDAEASHFIGGPRAPEVVWRTIAAYIGHAQLRGYSYWAVEERTSGDLIGAEGLWNSPEWKEMELGYYLFPKAQGKGYATEAAHQCQQLARDVFHSPSLVSYIDSSNQASRNVAMKLDGKLDGTIELAHFGPHDVYRYW